jgi:hypothetical protein
MNIPEGLIQQCLDDSIHEVMGRKSPPGEFEPIDDLADIFTEAFQRIFKIALVELGNEIDEVEDYIENVRINVKENAARES